EERRRRVNAFDFAAASVDAARIDVADPEVKAGFVRFAAKEIEILLSHKVFSRIKRIQTATVSRCRESSFSMSPQLTEASLRRAERKIRSRRRQNIKAVCLNVIEMIIALRVGNRQTTLAAAHSHRGALDRGAGVIDNLAANGRIGCRRRRV